ncbi:MAG: hypothetical protein AABZ47_10720 [Planctomycetota bacterium]
MMLTSLLFERPWTLGFVLVAMQFILIGCWSWQRTRNAARCVWIGFGLIPILLILSRIVVTPGERMMIVCRELAQAVDDGDMAAIGSKLSPNFEAGGFDRAELLVRAERALTQTRVDDESLWGFDIRVDGSDSGVVEFTVSARVRTSDLDLGWIHTRWRVQLRKANDHWSVAQLEPLPIPPLNLREIRSLFR